MCGWFLFQHYFYFLSSMQNWIRQLSLSYGHAQLLKRTPQKTSALGDTARNIYKNRNLLRRKQKEKWRDSFDWSSFFSSSVRCSVLLFFFFCRFICMMIRRNFHPLSQSGVTMSSAPPGNDPPPWLIWVESHHIVAFLLWGKVDEDSFEWKKHHNCTYSKFASPFCGTMNSSWGNHSDLFPAFKFFIFQLSISSPIALLWVSLI